MSNICLILGKSGSGKSTSIKGLNPEETIVFNVLKKKLPFKGSNKSYNADNKNLFNLDDYDSINKWLLSVDKGAPYVKNIIIDDGTYIMRKEYFKTAKQTGYTKYTEMASHFQSIISTAENMYNEALSTDSRNAGALRGLSIIKLVTLLKKAIMLLLRFQVLVI